MWRSLTGMVKGRRERGSPPSGNGASSLHLHWLGAGPAVEASAVLEVMTPPAVGRLYFWALQVTFEPNSAGAHLGLQWNPRHQGSTAVNWGGYGAGGGLLEGTTSNIPSTVDDPNTRTWPWAPARRYRLGVRPGSRPGWWAGEVTDLDHDETVEVRQLAGGGDHLGGIMVWSEVFADCDAPSVAVRWSELTVVDRHGTVSAVRECRVGYQDFSRGGCTNTNAAVDDVGWLQRTNVFRATPEGTILGR